MLRRSDPSLPDQEKRVGRSLTLRLDTLKVQYERDLVPLISQREILSREIQELKGVRETFLEETTVLNARNEELAQLSAQYTRRMETADMPARSVGRGSSERLRSPPSTQTLFNSTTPPLQSEDDTMKPNRLMDSTPSKGKFMNWPTRSASKVTKDPMPVASPSSNSVDNASKAPVQKMATTEHNFQQLSVLRFTRCDQCSDKMWGSQLRCTGELYIQKMLKLLPDFHLACNISIHVRCVHNVSGSCNSQNNSVPEDAGPLRAYPLFKQVHVY